jgi:UDP-2-acetamido-2-deoxy-ribo-hexuluronate aminotransferase
MQFVNLQAQYQAYKNEIDEAMQQVLDEGSFILGPAVRELEENLSLFTGAPYALSCASGTDALWLALTAWDIGPGDEVITTPFTFFATAEMIALTGATPVFCDVRESDLNLDVTKIEEKITPRTRAIMPVGLYGQPCEMDKIEKIAKKHGLVVIEDAAQSFGASYKQKRSCNLSELATTSFFPAKPLGCYGDGGAVFCQSEKLYKKMESLRNHGQIARYTHEYIGINGRMDSLQAAVLNVKLSHYEKEIEVRNAVAQGYNKGLAGLAGIQVPEVSKEVESVWAQYTVRCADREGLQQFLTEKGVPTAVHYPKPLHMQTPFLVCGTYRKGSLPVAEKAAGEVLSLPMCAWIKPSEQEEVIDLIRAFAK